MRITMLSLFLLFAFPIYGAEGTIPPSMPLKQQEKAEQLNKSITTFDTVQATVDLARAELNQVVANKTNHCMKAIGNTEFCSCFANKALVGVSLTQYVEFFSYGAEEFDYQKLSPDGKKLYDNIREVRDQCVNWNGKENR